MNKTEQLAFMKLLKRCDRLENVLRSLVKRVTKLEGQNRSIKAKAHQAGLNAESLGRSFSASVKKG